MSPEQYIVLYEKYLAGLCTPDEENLLLQYKDTFKLIDDHDQKLSAEDKLIRKRIYNQITKNLTRIPHKTIRLKWWMAAAVLLIGIFTAGIFLTKKNFERQAVNLPAKNKPIKPGVNAAILTLGDGSSVVLKDGKEGADAYLNSKANAAENAKNTITTPRGGQYKATLPDGTVAWLNAESSLTYPVQFKGKERVVFLSGEVYFEVEKNKQKPFIVRANTATVSVLGTHFNISAYPEEPAIKTTLLEGSVRLASNNATALLVPGEQGTVGLTNGKISKKQVNTDQVVGWKNGYFIFRDDNIHDIMKQISRWYDVEVEYRGNMEHKNFGGIYSKTKDINELLKGLELTGIIHFKIEGRRIIVMS